MTQEEIRARYEEIDCELRRLADEEADLENSLLDLQRECQHPNRGTGKDVAGFECGWEECPDCGHTP